MFHVNVHTENSFLYWEQLFVNLGQLAGSEVQFLTSCDKFLTNREQFLTNRGQFIHLPYLVFIDRKIPNTKLDRKYFVWSVLNAQIFRIFDVAIVHMNPIDNLYDNISVEHIHPTHSKCMSTNNINKLLSNTVIRDRDTSDLNVFYTYTKMELNSRQMLPINIMH